MTQHFITKCSCGAVIAQCGCPSREKVETVIERGCALCHNATAKLRKQVEVNNEYSWHITDHLGNTAKLSRADWEFVHSIIHEHYHGED